MISMSAKFQHLKPGDLITADLMNAIFDALNSLDARLAAVEKRLAKRARSGPAPRRPAKPKRKA
jgi:hypothetical protein